MTHDDDYLVAKNERYGYRGGDRFARLSIMVDRVSDLHVPTHDDYDLASCMECGQPYPCRTAAVLKRWSER